MLPVPPLRELMKEAGMRRQDCQWFGGRDCNGISPGPEVGEWMKRGGRLVH